jgi:hypothetical protein
MLGGDTRLKASIAVDVVRHGYIPRFDIGASGGPGTAASGVDPLKTLLADLSTGRYAAVVVGPLLSFDWASFVPRFPRTRFVLVDAPAPTRDAPANAVFLTFDRTTAFRSAGRAAAEAVRGMQGASGAGASGAELASRIGVLTSADSDLDGAETASFMDGVAEILGGSRPAARTLPAATDRNVIVSTVDQMRRAGTQVFLLGLAEHDSLALEALRDGGGSAVVADWLASGAYAAQVLASIEVDVPGGITRAWDALRAGVGHVDGPVRVATGKKI